jgi:hypothetical protein
MNELHQLIYIDLLELYMLDLELENRGLYLQLIAHQTIKNPIPPSYPWDKTPYNPMPPWVVTC